MKTDNYAFKKNHTGYRHYGQHFLSVIIPAYKEEKTIAKNIKRISGVLKKIRYPGEIIIVVDGLSDNTYQFARKAARTNPVIRIVGYPDNYGKGYAVRYGFTFCRGDIIAFIDAGMEINPNGLSMCLEHLEWYKADIIVGSKRHPASKVIYPLHRRILSFGYQLYVYLLFGLKIKDTQVGLKFFRREVLVKVLPKMTINKYAFDIELLAVANHLGFKRLYEAPIEMKSDFGNFSEISSPKIRSMIISMFYDTLKVFYKLKILKTYQKPGQTRKIGQINNVYSPR